jgi:iron complex transport system substrate-binding protein
MLPLMRICSFLPSATEILFALGVGESVAGVTFECDYPPEVAGKTIVVNTMLRSGLTPQEIDDAVRKQAAAGASLYFVDLASLEAIQPDLVITQDLCHVCALNTTDVARFISGLSSRPQVLSLSPHTLDQVFEDIERVGEVTGRVVESRRLVEYLRGRVNSVRQSVRLTARPRVLCLEWLSPPYQGGHWIPEMVELAGGNAVLAAGGEKSVRLSWQQVFEADPEIVILMPCGFHLRETIAQYKGLALPEGWMRMSAAKNGRIYAVDGTAYFSRPGPRLITGLEILQAIVNQETFQHQETVQEDTFEHLPAESVSRLSHSCP